MDETTTTLPPDPCARIWRTAARAHVKVPRRWVSITASKSSSLMFQRTRSRRIPAFVHMMSRRPKACKAAATSRSAASADPTAQTSATTRPPALPIASAVASATSASTSLTTTAQPASASARAYARPMPRPLPVTTAALPSRFMGATLGELDLDVLAARNVSGLAVDRVRDSVVCICEEHAAVDARLRERVDAHVVGEPACVAAVAVLRWCVHRSDPDHLPDRGVVSHHAHRLAGVDPHLEAVVAHHPARGTQRIACIDLDLRAEGIEPARQQRHVGGRRRAADAGRSRDLLRVLEFVEEHGPDSRDGAAGHARQR